MKPILLSLLAATMAAPVGAQQFYTPPTPSPTYRCFEPVYREEYVPGNAEKPGTVQSWTENREVPCNQTPVQSPFRTQTAVQPSYFSPTQQTQVVAAPRRPQACDETRALFGSLLAGGLAFAAGESNRDWAIPLGSAVGRWGACR